MLDSLKSAGQSLLSDAIGKNSHAYIVIHDKRAGQNLDATKTFDVQFNPSEMQIYASCSPDSKSDTAPGQNRNSAGVVVDTPTGASFELTVTLFFDAVFPADSFMWEKYANTLTSPVSAQNIKTVAAMATHKVYSVQPQVEGLIAALRDKNTNTVTFFYGGFNFTGNVRHVVAKYTMFSASGRPVRAEVTLRIRQKYDCFDPNNSWRSAYESAFIKDKGDTSLVKPDQKGGSLINFTF